MNIERRTDLSAPFITQVPPFMAVVMNTIPKLDALSFNVAEVSRCRSPFCLVFVCSLRDKSHVILYLASLEPKPT